MIGCCHTDTDASHVFFVDTTGVRLLVNTAVAEAAEADCGLETSPTTAATVVVVAVVSQSRRDDTTLRDDGSPCSGCRLEA